MGNKHHRPAALGAGTTGLEGLVRRMCVRARCLDCEDPFSP